MPGGMQSRMQVVEADITTLPAGAIVNAANERLAPGGGVCGAIHRAAGPALAAACAKASPCTTGDARITPGFDLPADYVIHAVGPVWRGGKEGEPGLLAGCYRAALDLAAEAGCTSIAFPAISTGIFGYPAPAATKVAVETCRTWLSDEDRHMDVTFCCFDAATASLYETELTA